MPVDLSSLNPDQAKAVTAPMDRPTLVIAGAGSGKTTTLIKRIEWMVDQGYNPDEMVAMTFGAKAAHEVYERLAIAGVPASTKNPYSGVLVKTIHAFGYNRINDDRINRGVRPLYPIKPSTSVALVRLSQFKTPDFPQAINWVPADADLAELAQQIVTWQYDHASIDDVIAATTHLHGSGRWMGEMYRAYTLYKQANHYLDFTDMLVKAIEMYDDNPEVAAADRKLFTYALVDELQDTSDAQWRIIEQLWAGQPIYGVGDPRQAIYVWRGATPEKLLRFKRTWPETELIHLTVNYRSTPEILAPAQRLVRHTVEAAASGEMVAHRSNGVHPEVYAYETSNDEAGEVALQVERLHERGVAYKDIVVLYRTNTQSIEPQAALTWRKIPFVIRGSNSVWERRAVRNLLSPLQLVRDPYDLEAFKDSVNPLPYLGRKFIDAVVEGAGEDDLITAAARTTKTSGKALNSGQLTTVRGYVRLLRQIADLPPQQALAKIYTDEYKRWVLSNNTEQTGDGDSPVIELLDRVIDKAGEFDTIADFLDFVATQNTSDKDTPADAVQLSTIHRAKGLEWGHVFLIGMYEGKLPHFLGDESEERRLAYVAITRARDGLYVSYPTVIYTAKGEIGVDPSRYLDDAGFGWGEEE